MEHYLEVDASGATLTPRALRFTWVRENTQQSSVSEGPKVAFKLLILFLLTLYSNIAVVYKALDPFRPALVVALAAIFMLVVELGQSHRRFYFLGPQGFLLVAFLGVAFVSSFDAMWARLAFDRTSDIGKILLIYVLLENAVTSEDRLRKVMLAMVAGGVIPSLGVIYNYAHGILIEHTRAAWKGLFGNPNEAAYGLIVLVPIAVALASKARFVTRVALFGALGTYLIAIFLTFSRGGLLALLAVFALIGWRQKSTAIRAVIVAGLILAVSFAGVHWGRSQGFTDISQDTTYMQRIATIKAGIAMFEAKPLFGVGPGCSIVAYPLYVPIAAHCGCQSQLVIHNSFVQVLSEVGIFGFAVFMLFLGYSILDARKLQKGPLANEAVALEIALWGFVICSLSGGFTYTWWPYILIGLVMAARHISTEGHVC